MKKKTNRMTKEMYLRAVEGVIDVYEGKRPEIHNIKSTEFLFDTIMINNRIFQRLSIGGSDELIDWLWNIFLRSKNGVKYCSYLSAERILERINPNPNLPLLITGHSKAGPTAMYIHQLLQNPLLPQKWESYCVAFAPARGFKEEVKLKNCTMFIDPDDFVPAVGWSVFTHPECDVIFLPDDASWYNVRKAMNDHSIYHIESYIEEKILNEEKL